MCPIHGVPVLLLQCACGLVVRVFLGLSLCVLYGMLQAATIRAAAVTALAKFGASVPSLRSSISILLTRCMDDDDDEVRDRATLHFKNLEALRAAGVCVCVCVCVCV